MMNFVERHFGSLALMLILLLLMMAHGIMLHWNRPPEMIHWVETLISGVFSALIPILAREKEINANNKP